MSKEEILNFIKQHNLAVISTVNNINAPQSAVVEFGELNDLTIIIDTLKTSRKYINLQANDKVAVVIGWDKDITIQIDGVAKELEGAELGLAQEAYFAKNPRARKWQTKPDIAYFAISPKWLRYSDVSKQPWQIEEFEF